MKNKNNSLAQLTVKVQGACKAIDSKLINGKTYVRLNDNNLKAFNT